MSFSIFLIFGMLVGLFEVFRQAGESLHERISRLDDAIVLLLVSIGGARLDYCLLRWPYFSQHGIEIPQFWLGGLGWPGAIIGGLLAIGLIGWLHVGTSRRLIADSLLPLLCPMAVACWLGAWSQNEAYGWPVPVDAWYGSPVIDSTGVTITRFPLQPIAAVIIVGISALGDYLASTDSIPGRKISIGFLGFSLVMLVSTFLRGDPSPRWIGMRYDTWFAGLFVMIGLAGYIGTWLWQSSFRVPQTSNTI
jgi:prolipoprotein diacylglyceryltransferase